MCLNAHCRVYFLQKVSSDQVSKVGGWWVSEARELSSWSFVQACQFMGLFCVKLDCGKLRKSFHREKSLCVFCFVDESCLRSQSEAPSLRAPVRKRS